MLPNPLLFIVYIVTFRMMYCIQCLLLVLMSSLFMATPLFAATAADLPPPKGCDITGVYAPAKPATKALTAVFPPVQLDMRTPLAPTVLPAAGRNYLIHALPDSRRRCQ